ncbi:alpha/beta hydrolase [Marinomonas piezotolerans]|uniref:Alpha/beta hydrolase n=1 Tax=Marinomonas piezotolerans TaxID=2213058 RepID=A0A370U7P8_9GAMM|nr:alpha/beta hydrolase [Marinomonas piezotolerans]RDL43758.1 alpha/beta hydrolase [Marinomonas piezotolerans]
MKAKLVCLTGLLCDELVWQGVAERLETIADVNIISFAGFDDLTLMAQHVLEKVQGDFALAGHSMGARVALEVYRLAPERVTHLALLNTGVHPKSEKEVPGRIRLLELAKEQGTEALAVDWLRPMMSPKGLKNSALMADLERMVSAYSVDQFVGQINALMNRPNAQAILTTITVPTLLLSGTEDSWSPAAQHQTMQEAIMGSELVVVEGAGHMAPVEDPDNVAAAMQAWLEKGSKSYE